MKPEEKARQEIDILLEQAGWVVQDYYEVNLQASLGVAVREFPLKLGYADYLLFADGKPVAVVEAKPEGTTLSGVAEQTAKYIANVKESMSQLITTPPFSYETTGTETFFRDLRDPESCSRRVFAFHQPKTLLGWLFEEDTLRERLKKMPPLIKTGLRDCQIEAIENLNNLSDRHQTIRMNMG